MIARRGLIDTAEVETDRKHEVFEGQKRVTRRRATVTPTVLRALTQVKSEQTPVDHPAFSQPVGTMQAVGADQGLLVSWSGFKFSVDRELPRDFFKVLLWDQRALPRCGP